MINGYVLILIVFGALFGAAMGSFACCQAWRIRLKEEGKKDPGNRSVCLKCGKKLKWYENIPIASWLLQGGKCRKCGEKIGRAEIVAELFGAVSFGLIVYKFTLGMMYTDSEMFATLAKIDWIQMVIVLLTIVGMIVLMVYDAKWQEMPMGILIFIIVMGALFVGVRLVREGTEPIVGVIEAVGLLGGLYYLLYFLSKERLVGGGDWLLGLAIGLFLGSWWLALIELCLSNLLGAIVMLPQKKKKIAFGPFLVVAFVAIFVLGDILSGLMAN